MSFDVSDLFKLLDNLEIAVKIYKILYIAVCNDAAVRQSKYKSKGKSPRKMAEPQILADMMKF